MGIPSKISYKLFLNIAILIDQYDCINLIRPWLSTWALSPEIPRSRMRRDIGWLFIDWVVGWEDSFTYFATELVKEPELGDVKRSQLLCGAYIEGIR